MGNSSRPRGLQAGHHLPMGARHHGGAAAPGRPVAEQDEEDEALIGVPGRGTVVGGRQAGTCVEVPPAVGAAPAVDGSPKRRRVRLLGMLRCARPYPMRRPRSDEVKRPRLHLQQCPLRPAKGIRELLGGVSATQPLHAAQEPRVLLGGPRGAPPLPAHLLVPPREHCGSSGRPAGARLDGCRKGSILRCRPGRARAVVARQRERL
mmetsp:Transcript_64709/g.204297  ORF Transcript_64709/g.204297 Transcript_64709/m.204297 type:complete len:206 (+) Transcript_64709:281-898(+)